MTRRCETIAQMNKIFPFAVFAVLTACGAQTEFDGSLEALLVSQPERFAAVMNDPARYRVQIIYTQIHRDAENQPTFVSYKFRVNDEAYFYPASTVKLPVAALALEKLKRLDLAGVDRNTTMLTGSAAPFQTEVTRDKTAASGLPSVGQYVRKITAVSDNDAFNRLYEFMSPRAINDSLRERGFSEARIVHRLEVFRTPLQNAWTNPVRFVDGNTLVYEQPAVRDEVQFPNVPQTLLGAAEVIDGKRVDGPKNFATKNALSLQALHDVVKAIMFSKALDARRRFDLTEDDARFLQRHMALYPAETGIGAYADPTQYPDGYVKFLLYGGSAADIPDNIRIFNKVGDAYGFLTDAAYIVDFDAGVEFLLAATIYTNANETFNDNQYEYDQIGLPFLRDLGQAIYEVELARPKQYPPDLDAVRGLFRP